MKTKKSIFLTLILVATNLQSFCQISLEKNAPRKEENSLSNFLSNAYFETEFLELSVDAVVHCPNEVPQPLFIPFKQTFGADDTVTHVYLFQPTDIAGKFKRTDLIFSVNSVGLMVWFDEIMPDGDYVLQMVGFRSNIAVCPLFTTVRVQNPQPLIFEKTVFHCSGTEYHQGIPRIIIDGEIEFLVKNYVDDCSIFWDSTEYKTSEIVFSNLTPGDYPTTFRYNENRCEIDVSTTVELLNNFLHVRIDESSPILCYGSTEAALRAVVEGVPTSNVTFSWYREGELLPNKDSSYLKNLWAGEYSVVCEFEGLRSTYSFTIEEPEEFELMVHSLVEPLCHGSTDGQIHIELTGGTPPYRYTWSHGVDSNFIDQLGTGLYTAIIYDQHNCTLRYSAMLRNPPLLTMVLSSNPVSSWGANDGSIHAVVRGGTPPYTFEWGCSTAAPMTNLKAGIYHLTLTDAKGCKLKDSIEVRSPDRLEINSQIRHCTYFGAIQGVVQTGLDDGRIECWIEGGVEPYSYQWFYQSSNEEWTLLNSKTSSYIDSLTGGFYALLVTDSNGQTISDTFLVMKPKPLISTISDAPLLCFGRSDGVLQAFANGGIPPYTYLWSTGETGDVVENLSAGDYHLTITDSLNVVSNFSVRIEGFFDAIAAEFWHSHEAVVEENFVAVNIGTLPFDSVIWGVTPAALILFQDDDYFLLRFLDTGYYEISLTAYKNKCFEEQIGMVRVVLNNEIFLLKSVQTSSLSDLKIFPNPASDFFNFSVQAKRPTVLNWTLTRVGTGLVVLSGQTQTDSNGFATQRIPLQKQPCGVYVFRVFTGNEHISTQLIIH